MPLTAYSSPASMCPRSGDTGRSRTIHYCRPAMRSRCTVLYSLFFGAKVVELEGEIGEGHKNARVVFTVVGNVCGLEAKRHENV